MFDGNLHLVLKWLLYEQKRTRKRKLQVEALVDEDTGVGGETDVESL